MKTLNNLKEEIRRQKSLIEKGELNSYDFGDWVADDILSDEVLGYFMVDILKGDKVYNFIHGNKKLTQLIEAM